MKLKFYWLVLLLLQACGRDELTPRETSLLENWKLTDVDMSQVNLQRFLWKTDNLGFLVGWDGAHYRTLDGGKT